jgi:hypothetical protein
MLYSCKVYDQNKKFIFATRKKCFTLNETCSRHEPNPAHPARYSVTDVAPLKLFPAEEESRWMMEALLSKGLKLSPVKWKY